MQLALPADWAWTNTEWLASYKEMESKTLQQWDGSRFVPLLLMFCASALCQSVRIQPVAGQSLPICCLVLWVCAVVLLEQRRRDEKRGEKSRAFWMQLYSFGRFISSFRNVTTLPLSVPGAFIQTFIYINIYEYLIFSYCVRFART